MLKLIDFIGTKLGQKIEIHCRPCFEYVVHLEQPNGLSFVVLLMLSYAGPTGSFS